MSEPTARPDAASFTHADDPAPISVRVLLFSVLREKVGSGSLTLPLPPEATGAALLDALAEAFPATAAYRSVVRLAVNEEYASEHVSLADGDEVALITPVSGG